MRYITIPSPLEVPLAKTDPNQRARPVQLIEFSDLVLDIWTQAPLFNENHQSRRIAGILYERFRAARPGQTLALEDREWELLCLAVRDPSFHPQNPQQALLLLKHTWKWEELVLNAPHEEPRSPETPP